MNLFQYLTLIYELYHFQLQFVIVKLYYIDTIEYNALFQIGKHTYIYPLRVEKYNL